jgi:hypothetical protein
MNLTTARLEVRERIGELTADFFTDSEVDRAINEAVRRFSNEEKWPWLYTEYNTSLAASDDTLELPSDVSPNRAFNVALVDDNLAQPRSLERVQPEAGFRLRYANWLRESAPKYYYLTSAIVDGSAATNYVMRVVPSPDLSYDLFLQYMRVPSLLTAGGDTLDVPEQYSDAIPAYASGKLFLKEFAISNKAGEQFSIYGSIVESARDEAFTPMTDEKVAWGREHPGESRLMTEHDYVMGRIPGTGLGS